VRRYRRTKAQKRQLATCPSPDVAEALKELFLCKHKEREAQQARMRAGNAVIHTRNARMRAEEALAERKRIWQARFLPAAEPQQVQP
jgi:hypothetical protein